MSGGAVLACYSVDDPHIGRLEGVGENGHIDAASRQRAESIDPGALRQIHDNVTLNYLILQGLKAIGITIVDADVVEDGRRLRGRRANNSHDTER